MAAMRGAVLTIVAGTAAALIWATASNLLPPIALVASLPGAATATLIAMFPPPPTRLRTLGWTLFAASVLTTGIVIAGAP